MDSQSLKGLSLVALLFMLSLAACTQDAPDAAPVVMQLHGQTMGTSYSVKIINPPSGLSQTQVENGLQKQLEMVNAHFSTYLSDSELSRFNANPSTDWISVSEPLLKLIQTALALSRDSDGAFDITVGPLVNLWGFGPEIRAEHIPDAAQITAVLARCGYQQLHTRNNPPALKKDHADLYVDLSAIAKGYGVDRLAQWLEQHQVKNYLVEIGGEIRAQGKNAQANSWQIAIEKPEAGKREVWRVVDLDNQGLASSGNYRNFFEINQQRFAHTIHPKTGWPVQHALLSATVFHANSMTADALATLFMVLGREEALSFARQRNIHTILIEQTPHGLKEWSSF